MHAGQHSPTLIIIIIIQCQQFVQQFTIFKGDMTDPVPYNSTVREVLEVLARKSLKSKRKGQVIQKRKICVGDC